MITLATLEDATPQEVFDQAARHLLTQMKKSATLVKGRTWCEYRGPDGLKCVAGCFISDTEYNKNMDDHGDETGWGEMVADGTFPTTPHTRLMVSLQTVHDMHEPDAWKAKLKELAFRYSLGTRVLKEFP